MSAADNLSKLQFSAVTLPRKGLGLSGDIHVADEHKLVGKLNWEHSIGAEISSIWVHPEYRRQGLATEMYNRASAAAGQPLGHNAQRTEAGEGWASAVGGKLPPRIKAAE